MTSDDHGNVTVNIPAAMLERGPVSVTLTLAARRIAEPEQPLPPNSPSSESDEP